MKPQSLLESQPLFFRPRSQAPLRLFCFPYAGAGASIYRAWSNELSAEIEVVPVQLPGRETRIRETPFTDITPMVEMLVDSLADQLRTPFAFFGHSMGALISFELAQKLRSQGAPTPDYLFVSGRRAPPLRSEAFPLHTLPDHELVERLRKLNGTPEEFFSHPELLKLWLPVIRADFAVCENYVYREAAPLDCPTTTFGGLGDVNVGRDALEAWRNHTSAAFKLRMLPGDHFFLHQCRPMLLRAITDDLRPVMDRQASGASPR
jgi:medium-chain acyl-[acyl-carrier-protein] hydrolase